MTIDEISQTALWWAVILSGLYHGINPGMGWPLAVSAGLTERNHRAALKAFGLLAFGHLMAMLAILLPFSLMTALVSWQKELRVGAGLLVLFMGIYLLANRRHPRILARVHPVRLALWPFLVAIAHGAGLMLVPIYLGLYGIETSNVGHMDHSAAGALMRGNVINAFGVAMAHTLAMTVAGAAIAVIIYSWLGLKCVSQAWINLDVAWALSLMLVGIIGIYSASMLH